MSIEKESSGVPEVDPTRPTTKVNLFMIIAVAAFYAIMYSVLAYIGKKHDSVENRPSPSIHQTPAETAPRTDSR